MLLAEPLSTTHVPPLSPTSEGDPAEGDGNAAEVNTSPEGEPGEGELEPPTTTPGERPSTRPTNSFFFGNGWPM